MVAVPDYMKHFISRAKEGYRDDSLYLIKALLEELNTKEILSVTLRDHLIDCLQRTLETDDANSGFFLKMPRGKRRKDTIMRDYRVAQIMVASEGGGMSYKSRLAEAEELIRIEFQETLSDKVLERAYTMYKPIVLINMET